MNMQNLYLSRLKVGDPLQYKHYTLIVRSNENGKLFANNPMGEYGYITYAAPTELEIIFEKVYPIIGFKKLNGLLSTSININ